MPLSSVTASLKSESSSVHATQAILWLLGFMMVFAPIFRSGHAAIALAVLQVSAVTLIILTLWRPRAINLTTGEAVALIALVVLPLLYLVPLPAHFVQWLPGRASYTEAVSLLGEEYLPKVSALSVYPQQTESVFLTLLIPVAVFLGTRVLNHKQTHHLIVLLIAMASLQAALGLMQFGSGRDSDLYLGMTFTHFDSGVGTYTNRNHLAGLLEMVLPITLALFFFHLGRGDRGTPRGWRDRFVFFSTFRGHRAFVFGSIALLLIVGLVFTRSRAGIALAILGIMLVTFAFARRIGGENVYGAAGTVLAFAVGSGIAIGLAPVLDRFASEDPMDDARWNMFSATMDGIVNFFPVGSGPGTFSDAFHAFQPLQLGGYFINQAHNDYLEWIFEAGALAAALIVLMLGLYLTQWGKVWTKDAWSRFRFLQIGSGIGILLILLHELVDYNLQAPANMVYFAFLAGIFFSDPEQEAVTRARRRKKRRSFDLGTDSGAGKASEVVPTEPPSDQIRNPFLD